MQDVVVKDYSEFRQDDEEQASRMFRQLIGAQIPISIREHGEMGPSAGYCDERASLNPTFVLLKILRKKAKKAFRGPKRSRFSELDAFPSANRNASFPSSFASATRTARAPRRFPG